MRQVGGSLRALLIQKDAKQKMRCITLLKGLRALLIQKDAKLCRTVQHQIISLRALLIQKDAKLPEGKRGKG